MIDKIKSTLAWLPYYLARDLRMKLSNYHSPKHIYFCICDHFEPYWQSANKKTAQSRITRWLAEWPRLADSHLDSCGNKLKYSFFYPEEEYQKEDLDALAHLCRAGYGEVEIHLHHDNDTEDNLEKTLIDFKKRLHEVHGLLSKDVNTGEIVYGFIHGNWALNNSRSDGRMCGVNNETMILKRTGCYADFTMPSAPSDTQTSKINSIYYDKGDLHSPKSHNWGENVYVGGSPDGLLMVQGPLGLSWRRRKWWVLPRIENGGLMKSTPIDNDRIREWINQRVHVSGAEDHVFVKIYAHGAQEGNMDTFFTQNGGMNLLQGLKEVASQMDAKVHFVSAREMTNAILSLESGQLTPVDKINTPYVSST